MEGISLLLLIAAMINVALIWCIFSIRKSVEQHAFIATATFRLLSRIAENKGIDVEDIRKELDKKL